MRITPAPQTYTALQKTIHWVIAGLVACQILFGESMTRFVDATGEGGTATPQDSLFATAHYWSGLLIVALLAARLFLRLRYGVPPHTQSTPRLMSLAAAATHWLFYGLLVAVPLSGLLTYYGLADLGDIHGLAKPVFLVLIAGHAGAALFHQLVLKDGTLSRMLPGTVRQ